MQCVQYARVAIKIGQQPVMGGRQRQKQAGANNMRLPELTWSK